MGRGSAHVCPCPKRAEVREARKVGRECRPRLVKRDRALTFDDVLADYLIYSKQSKRSHRHDQTRGKRLQGTFGGRLASDITSKDVEAFKAKLATERAVATVNHHLRLLKAIYNRAIRQGALMVNPVRAVPLYREHNARNRCLTPEEEARLTRALPGRLRSFLIVALRTGMRRGELQGLRWEDVDFAHLRVTAGDGWCRPLHRAASWRMENAGHGPALCTSEPGPYQGCGGVARGSQFRGRNRHQKRH